ncbi:hypothetical protein ACFX2A_006524 [Malus domestica]
MGRPKHPTRRSSIASRNPSPTKRENGQMSSRDVYGHIAPPKDEQPVKLLSLWRLVRKQSFLPTSSCQASTLYCQTLSKTVKRWPEERRKQTITRIVAYQQQLISSYNKRAKIWQFQPGDLFLRKAFIIACREGSKKMDPIWEGHYKISRVGGKGSYTLATMNDKEIEKQWNAYNLRKYHV